MSRLILPRQASHALIARRQERNRNERQNKRERARDAPAAEDDAEVLGRPGEEHLHGIRQSAQPAGRQLEVRSWNQHSYRTVHDPPCPSRHDHGPYPWNDALSGP